MYAEKFSDNIKIHLDKLSPADKDLFDRIYKISIVDGKLIIPSEMEEWVKNTFGNIDDISCQEIIKINNIVTYEGSIFNVHRTSRPFDAPSQNISIDEILKHNRNKDFSTPLQSTPSDLFGRIKKNNTITAANIAKYDSMHSLIIAINENPLEISEELVKDYCDTAKEWFESANQQNPDAIYPFFLWNSLWRAGASLIHGHAQLALTQDMPYAKIDLLRRVSEEYEIEFDSNYFEDDFYIHKKLGLGFVLNNCNIQMKLTPIKEKEVRITSHEFNDDLIKTIYKILNVMINHTGVQSFNVAIYLPPLIETLERWDHMPVIVQIVDRGYLDNQTSDFGAMELYGQSVIGTNPYKTMKDIFTNCL